MGQPDHLYPEMHVVTKYYYRFYEISSNRVNVYGFYDFGDYLSNSIWRT